MVSRMIMTHGLDLEGERKHVWGQFGGHEVGFGDFVGFGVLLSFGKQGRESVQVVEHDWDADGVEVERHADDCMGLWLYGCMACGWSVGLLMDDR